jgi:WhiB family redox-sensing transcriptional regulator
MTHADGHTPLAWQSEAECTQSDYRAKAICATCPVAAMCLEYALANGEEWGTWAGMNGAELKRLRVEREMERRT